MTEITVKLDWFNLLLAIALAPAIATGGLLMASVLYPPLMPMAFLFGIGSLVFGYVSYLVLGGPLMVLGQWLGADHPVLQGAIGFGAVWLIPAAHAAGLPFIADPEMAQMGQWFAPVWCATAAVFYTILCRENNREEET